MFLWPCSLVPWGNSYLYIYIYIFIFYNYKLYYGCFIVFRCIISLPLVGASYRLCMTAKCTTTYVYVYTSWSLNSGGCPCSVLTCVLLVKANDLKVKCKSNCSLETFLLSSINNSSLTRHNKEGLGTHPEDTI